MTSGAAALAVGIATVVSAGAVRLGAAATRARRTGCGFWAAYACTWWGEPLLGASAGPWFAIVTIAGVAAFWVAWVVTG